MASGQINITPIKNQKNKSIDYDDSIVKSLYDEMMDIDSTDYLIGEYDTEIHNSIEYKLIQLNKLSFGKYGRLSLETLKSIKPEYVNDIEKLANGDYAFYISFVCKRLHDSKEKKLMMWWDDQKDDEFYVDYYNEHYSTITARIIYDNEEVKQMLEKC